MTDGQTPRQADTATAPDRLSAARLLHIQRVDWQRGSRSPVEKYLEERSSLIGDHDVVLDLLYNEVILRQERGDVPAAEEYVRRFPHLADQVKLLFEVDHGLALGQSRILADTVAGENDRTASVAANPIIPGFEVIEVIGRGGMGIVYKARQIALDRVVALKMIRAGLHADEEDLRRFRTEALAAARLQHAGIAQVYDVAEYEGLPFIVLEYVKGSGLDRRLAGGPLPPADAAKLIAVLASAIHFAHERGVVHRDLKPANVLLAEFCNDGDQVVNRQISVLDPKITDFGLAKLMDVDAVSTQSGNIVGTPTYMAPEQAAGLSAKIGPATDVYALGTLLYECLTGHPPFQGQSAVDTLALIQHQDPVPPRQMRPNVPRDLETICLKCLEKDPRRRYPTAQALHEDLVRFHEGRPVRARPVRMLGRLVRWMRRHPAGSAVALLSALLVIALIVGARSTIDRKMQIDRSIDTALNEADLLRDEGKWNEALAATGRAGELLAQGILVSAEVRQRAEAQRVDVSFAVKLEKIQQLQGEVTQLQHELHPRRNADDYQRAFQDHGYTIGDANAEAIGQQIRGKPPAIREQIISAIDDWITIVGPPDEHVIRDRLSRVVVIADGGDEWRNHLRRALRNSDTAALKSLAIREDTARQAANAILLLAASLMDRDASAEAVDLLRRAQRQMPGEYWINNRLASYCMRLQPPATEEALRFALVAQALRPKDPGPYFYVGFVLQKLGRSVDAIDAFRRAAELDPEYYLGLLYLGDSLKKDEDWPNAATALRHARAIKPDVARIHHALAEVLSKTDQLDEAIAVAREAIRLKKTADHMNNLAIFLVATDKRAEALPILREAISLDPTFAAAQANLGYLQLQDNQIDECIATLTACRKLAPTETAVHLNLGRALHKKEKYEEALECFREVIRLRPAYADPHFYMGQTLEAMKDNEGAFAAYRDAIAADPKNPNGHCFLGLLYMKIGKPTEALPHLKNGHEIGSKLPKWTRPSADWVGEAEQQVEKLRKEKSQ